MMDPTRPLTFACNKDYNVDLAVRNLVSNNQHDKFSALYLCGIDTICRRDHDQPILWMVQEHGLS